jgi:hypothetical protein
MIISCGHYYRVNPIDFEKFQNQLNERKKMQKLKIFTTIICIIMLMSSISVVSAASMKSLGMAICPIKPGSCNGCQPNAWGWYCTTAGGIYGVVGRFNNSCDLLDYWDCPGNTCHCVTQGLPDHCCADKNDCRQWEH